MGSSRFWVPPAHPPGRSHKSLWKNAVSTSDKKKIRGETSWWQRSPGKAELCLARVTSLVPGEEESCSSSSPLGRVTQCRDLSRVRVEGPGCLCPGALGKLGSESAAGSRDRKPGLAVEKLKARLLLLFPGCPRADVALSHRILPDAAWGKRRGWELWGVEGPGCSPSR